MIKINGQAISEINETKSLGVIIDNKINWNDHIKYVAGKVSQGVGRMIKAKQYLRNMHYWHFIMHSFILLHLLQSYLGVNLRLKLIRLQNAVLQSMCKAKKLIMFLICMMNWGYFDWQILTNISLAGLFSAFVTIRFLHYSTHFCTQQWNPVQRYKIAPHFHIHQIKTNLKTVLILDNF